MPEILFKHRIPEEETVIGEKEIEFYIQHINEYKIYKVPFIQEISNLYNKANLLEAYSGMGFIGIEIAKSNPNLTIIVVESNEGVIRKYREIGSKTNLGRSLLIIKGEGEAIPFKEEYFDIAVSTNALHHWREPIRVLKEIIRVTKKGGHIFINDIRRDAHEDTVEVIIRNLKSREAIGASWFLKNFIVSWRASYTKEEVEQIAKMAGLEIFEIFHDAVTLTLRAIRGGNHEC